MSLQVPRKSFLAQLFKERELRPFTATQEELNMAKQSLIYKKKCNSNVHSLLFCKSFSSSSTFATQNERKILEEEKLKYFDYVRKSFKDKIPQEFQSQNKLKKALRSKILELKQNEDKNKDESSYKRPREGVEELRNKPKNHKQAKETKPNKKLKTKMDENEKKIIADHQIGADEQIAEDNFESEIDLHNDQIQQSLQDQEI